MIFDVFPQPTGLGHRSQITKRPVLRPFPYTDRLGLLAFWLSSMKVLCCFKYHILVLNTAIFRSSKSRHFFRKNMFSKALKYIFPFLFVCKIMKIGHKKNQWLRIRNIDYYLNNL
jgi:hypothetical protein